jgi:hypothetical protein
VETLESELLKGLASGPVPRGFDDSRCLGIMETLEG